MAIRYKVTEDRGSYPGAINPQRYPKGAVVMGSEYGIFLFKKRKDALAYIRHHTRPTGVEAKRFKILRVETIGRGRKLTVCPTHVQLKKDISIETALQLSKDHKYYGIERAGNAVNLFDGELSWVMWVCAPGTMVYPGVKVLT